jgi:uncharacterized surface protein with fasciclin (FAS1) repeats
MKLSFYYRIWLVSCSLLCCALVATAQVEVQWDKTLGGSESDDLRSAIATPDGGYLLAGYSESNASGDKSENNRGLQDYWIVKTDAEGHKQWDKTLGGSGYEGRSGMNMSSFIDVVPSSDGGYLLAGFSSSDAYGDKSENSKGKNDYWVVKLDEEGNKQWDKTFGSSEDDELHSAIATTDGGYLLAGVSSSPATADKSEQNKGGLDYWIIKIDQQGNKQWDKTLGGDRDESISDVILTSDGGYLLAGWSESNASGDKTENSKGGYCNVFRCSSDYWIVKIDKNGDKVWDKTLGGNNVDLLTSAIAAGDGGYLLAGYSLSDASADKSDIRKGYSDYWIVKVDRNGHKQWDKTYGGNRDEWLYSIISTPDGGSLLAGHSYSRVSADKSEDNKGGCDPDNNCPTDYWLVRVDGHGNKLWDKTLGGIDHDKPLDVILTAEGDYLLAGQSWSNASGDKSEDSRGGSDYWIIKVVETQAPFTIASFTLVNARTDQDIQPLQEGEVLDRSRLPQQLNVRANVGGQPASVQFRLNGQTIQPQNAAPYALFSDREGDYKPGSFPVGSYELSAIPYARHTATGSAGTALTIHFEVVQRSTINEIVRTDASFSILATALQQVGYLSTVKQEGPFTLFAPTDEAFEALLASLGLTDVRQIPTDVLREDIRYHLLVGEELRAADLSDEQQIQTRQYSEVTISIEGSTVKVNEATVITPDILASNGVMHGLDQVLMPPMEELSVSAMQLEASPNPGASEVSIQVMDQPHQRVEVSIMNQYGWPIRRQSFDTPAEREATFRVDVSALPPGVYMVQAQLGEERQTLRVIR